MIEPNLIKTNVSASNWREVVTMAGDLLQDARYIDGEFTQSMIETVEELGPYMILLPKLAFFHGKPSKAVKKVGISLIVLKDSVFFEEYDNEEIKCAFAFCAIDNESHLKVLQEFAGLLSNEKLIDLLVNNGSESDIMRLINDKGDNL